MSKAASILVGLVSWFCTGPRYRVLRGVAHNEALIHDIARLWYEGQTHPSQGASQFPQQPSKAAVRRVLLLAERLQ